MRSHLGRPRWQSVERSQITKDPVSSVIAADAAVSLCKGQIECRAATSTAPGVRGCL